MIKECSLTNWCGHFLSLFWSVFGCIFLFLPVHRTILLLVWLPKYIQFNSKQHNSTILMHYCHMDDIASWKATSRNINILENCYLNFHPKWVTSLQMNSSKTKSYNLMCELFYHLQNGWNNMTEAEEKVWKIFGKMHLV